MRLLDSDVAIDILRRYRPAVDWLTSLKEKAPGLPGFVLMELVDGCRDKQALQQLSQTLEPFRVYWPTKADCRRALDTFTKGHLTHNLGLLDAVIGECAVGLGATLCTFNTKHFKAISGLETEQPYPKSPPPS